MKALRSAIVALAFVATPAAADFLDDELSKRNVMVAAVALLVSTPPNCHVDNWRASENGNDLARFIAAYGHIRLGDAAALDRFVDDVKTQSDDLDRTFADYKRTASEEEFKSYQTFLCTTARMWSSKVRDVKQMNVPFVVPRRPQ